MIDHPGPPARSRRPWGVFATPLIVSLGFLQTPPEMAALMVGVVLLTAVGLLLNRAVGVPVPVWAAGKSWTTRKKRAITMLGFCGASDVTRSGCPTF